MGKKSKAYKGGDKEKNQERNFKNRSQNVLDYSVVDESFRKGLEEILISSDNEDDNISELSQKTSLNVKLFMWEFGQNDPKRDSGSKLSRLGFASHLRVGQTYNGIVLSSQATTIVSQSDMEIVQEYGISGINCSWNRLEEIPFGSMGKTRNQRLLPYLFAANTVNYGKPFKMNTAEALAACLYIVGFKDDAIKILDPFSYGNEFIKINYEALEEYSKCKDSNEVKALETQYKLQILNEKERKKEIKSINNNNNQTITTNYLNEDDFPPVIADDDYEYYEVEEEEQEPQQQQQDLATSEDKR